MPPEITSTIPALGIGGILALWMFYWYRQDVQKYTDQWKGQSESLIQVVKENSKAVTELAVLVRSLHEHMVNSDKITERRIKDKEKE
jgi:hypothetical protein